MTSIALCDDETVIVNRISNLLQDYRASNGETAIYVDKYNNPLLLLKTFKEGKYNLILLDIDMKPLNGLELAERIRKIDKKVYIVFITGYQEYALRASRIHTFAYLVKPISQDKIFWMMNEYYDYCQQLSQNEDMSLLVVASNGSDIAIEANKILYIEQYRNKTLIVYGDGHVETYTTLKEIQSQLQPSFAQCNKSYIVNMDKITKRERTACILKNGKEIPIGRSFQKEFRGVYLKHVDKYIYSHLDDEE